MVESPNLEKVCEHMVCEHMVWRGLHLAHPDLDHPKPPIANFGNFGPIWMKLGGEV